MGGSRKRLGRDPARAAWDRALQARQAGDWALARRWLERAHRLVPQDVLVGLTLGALLLEMGELRDAAPLLSAAAEASGAPDAWVALASCRFAMGSEPECTTALTRALRASVLTPDLAALAERVVRRWALPGWCGIERDGRVRFGPGVATVVAHADASLIEVTSGAGAFIGSPLPRAALLRVSGFVAAAPGGVEGWAWYPADPDRDPRLNLRGPHGELAVLAETVAEGVDGLPPLARPRHFAAAALALERLGTPISVTDSRGAALAGSPLGRVHAFEIARGPARVDARARKVDVVIPVHGAGAETLACLDSVLASVPAATVVHVVDDASPDPALAVALARYRDAGRIRLHRHAENRGFPASANTGLRAAAGRDVVLLNSDTLVAPGWLERLQQAAYSANAIGSATPLSNDGSIVSYGGDAAPPDLAATIALDRLAVAANARQVADLPVGVGFCLFLRRDCLDQVGPFREDVFGPGYGEENDWCLRGTRAGWRHVAALDVFVAHLGGRSFGPLRAALRRRQASVLNRLHPGYDALVAEHVAADKLFPARRRMDALRWAQGRRPDSVLLVTHADGGGVAEMVAARADALRRAGRRPVVLRPAKDGCEIEGFADLRYAMPAELPELAALLAPDRPTHIEVHHLLGHRRAVLGLAARLGVPIDTWVHDGAAFCPRINLVGQGGRYCGEPETVACEACVAALGSHLREGNGVRGLRARSALELAASRRVVVATADGARRLRRHFPAVSPVVERWEDDEALPPLESTSGGAVRIVIVGAIAVEKGYDVLLACVEDAASRSLPLEFVVCGFTVDDERLMAAGPAFVTGRFAAAAAVGLIRSQAADLAFVPSVCPESWCYGLSRAWQAGLEAVSFDLGAQAARIRATGRGAVLPLALPIPAVNDALLRLARSRRARQSLQPERETAIGTR